MSHTANSSHSRLIQLDVLRALAILLVMGRHLGTYPSQAGSLRPVAELWYRFGWTGVDLFFVLSGFLIGGLLFHELRTRGTLDVRRFLVRRIFKIWPAYFVYIGFVFVTFGLMDPRHSPWHAARLLLPNCLHVQNYWGLEWTAHTWSLAIEEHFYLALPLLLMLIARRRPGGSDSLSPVPLIAVAVIISCTAWRTYTSMYYYSPPFGWSYLLSRTQMRIDSLFFGVLLGYLYHFRPHLLERVGRHRLALIFVGLLMIAPMMVLEMETTRFVVTVGLTLLYLGYGCILLAALYAPPRVFRGALARAAALVGSFSYSIYLWHVEASWRSAGILGSLATFSHLSGGTRWVVATIVYVLVAFSAGVVLGRLVERPALALRERLFPARADALAQEPPDAASATALVASA